MAAGAIAGVTAGEICALLALMPMLLRLRGASAEKGCGRRLYLTALPLTVSSLVHSLAGIFDTRILISALRYIGYTARRATEVFGIYSGYCMTLFSFPPTLISALTASVMPAAAERYAAKDRGGLSRLALRAYFIAAAICIPAAYAFMAMPAELLGLLFRREADVLLAAPLLAALAPGLVALGFSAVSRALLIACGKTNFTLVSGLTGCAVRLLVTALCVRMPEIGIFGAPLGSAAGMIASVIPEMIAVSHLGIGFSRTLRCALPPLFAGLPILLLSPLVFRALAGILPKGIATIAVVCLFGLLNLALLFFAQTAPFRHFGTKIR